MARRPKMPWPNSATSTSTTWGRISPFWTPMTIRNSGRSWDVSWRAYAGPRRPGASRSPIEPPRIAVHGFGEIHRRFVVPLGPHAPKSFRLIGEVDVGVERAQPQRAIRIILGDHRI